MFKKDIRQQFREKRKALAFPEKNKLDDLLLIRFQSAELPFIQTLLSFWPIEKNGEPNAHLFTDWLAFLNPELVVAYPVTDFDKNEMRAIVPADEPFVENRFGLYEPAGGELVPANHLDMILVPLLAFDREGFRVGYGKGFYDRFLANCREDCFLVGFSYFEPVLSIGDKDEFDVPLNLCITPQDVYVF